MLKRATDTYKSMFGFKKAEGYGLWIFGNIASGAAAGASSSIFVYSLDYARTRLSADAKSIKGGGGRQFNGLIDVYKVWASSFYYLLMKVYTDLPLTPENFEE
jgi:hypothetical protein